MRLMGIEKDLISKDVAEAKLKELQGNYLSAFTNINNIRAMISDIKRELKKDDVDEKSLEIALDEQNNQLFTHIKAVKLHKKNILFIKERLGM